MVDLTDQLLLTDFSNNFLSVEIFLRKLTMNFTGKFNC